MHLLVHLRQFNNSVQSSCIHFIREEEDEHPTSSLESSVEIARVAEEVQEKMLKKQPVIEKVEEKDENALTQGSEQEPKNGEILDTTQDKENVDDSVSQVDHFV